MADEGIIRTIGDFEAEVTVQEQHTDELTITTHPVERGAPITDHAFKNPAILTIKAGWSAAAAASGALGGGSQGEGLAALYDDLLKMQSDRQPVSVQTGKRLYDNMLVKSLSVMTDQTTENVLMVTAQLQEIILVDTKEATMPGAADRADPQATAGVTDKGAKSPIPVAENSGLPANSFEIPMTPEAQTFSIPLAGQVLNMAMQWRDSDLGGWAMDIADQAGNALLSGLPLVSGVDMLEQYAHLGIGGALSILNTAGGDLAPTFDNLGIDTRLIFTAN